MAQDARQHAVDGRFEQAVLPHLPSGLRLARGLLGNSADAEDAVQDAAVRALRYFGTFDGGNARAWFLRIVRNTCFSARERNLQVRVDEFDEERHTDVDATPNAESRLSDRDGLDALSRALDGLPRRWRDLFVLREIDGLSYRELAARVGAPIGTVMSGLSRARRAVREALADTQASNDADRARDVRGTVVAFHPRHRRVHTS